LLLVLLGAIPARAQGVSPESTDVEIITEPPPAPEPQSPAPEPEPSAPEPEPAPEDVGPPPPPKKKPGALRVGAGVGFGFATDLITVGVSPQVSYIFDKVVDVEPGVSVRYQYTNDRLVQPSAIWHTFGTSLFLRVYPISTLFVLVEGELINTGFKQGGFTSGRTNYGNLFLGGGYVMGVGRGAFVALSLKVNVFRNAFYPSNIPIFGAGAGFGF
jgi:hypothetical protein